MLKIIKIGLNRTFHQEQGVPLCHYCDLDLDPMTFISELDLDIALIYPCAKNEVSRSRLSKVRARTDTHTQTDRHTHTDRQTHRHD